MLLKTKNGYWFEIDDEDYPLVSKFNWYVIKRRKRMSYVVTHVLKDGKRTFQSLHRLVMKADKGTQLDHANRNGLDNRKLNLRFCTHSQNQANKTKYTNNTSGYKGVYWNKYHRKFEAQIRVNKIKIHLGYFNTTKQAAEIYNEAAVKCFKDFSVTNSF